MGCWRRRVRRERQAERQVGPPDHRSITLSTRTRAHHWSLPMRPNPNPEKTESKIKSPPPPLSPPLLLHSCSPTNQDQRSRPTHSRTYLIYLDTDIKVGEG